MLLVFDHAFFGLHPVGYSMHSILWLLMLILGVHFLMKKILPGPIGILASNVYALSGILAIAVFWASCRHNLIAPCIGVWAFLFYLHWQGKGQNRFFVLSLAGFSLAFLAGEAAIAVIGYPIAYTLFAPREERKSRFISLMPLLLLTLIYLAFYIASGYGAGEGSEYQSPLSAPDAFLKVLPERMSAAVCALFFGGAVDLLAMDPAGKPFLVIGGICAIIVLIFMLRLSWSLLSNSEKYVIRWMIVGSLLSCVPMAASMTISFHLIVPLIGWSVVIAHLLYSRRLVRQGHHGFWRWFFQITCLLIFFIQLVVSPSLRLLTPISLKKMMNVRLEAAMKSLDQDIPQIVNKDVIILNASDLVLGLHSYFYRQLYYLPMPASWRIMYWGRGEIHLRRAAEKSFEMEFSAKSFLREKYHPGDIIHLPEMEIKIVSADVSGIQKVLCTLNRPLDDPALLFLTWKGKFVPVRIPAVGQSILLPNVSPFSE
jgi:hypothetical protein